MCNFLRVGSPLARDAVFIGWTPQVHGVAAEARGNFEGVAEATRRADGELTDTSPAPAVNAGDDVDAVGAEAEAKPVCNSKAKAKAKAAAESEVEDKCDERVAAIATVDEATAAAEPEVEDKGDERVASLAPVAADPEIAMRREEELDNSEKRSQELPAPNKAAKKKKTKKKKRKKSRPKTWSNRLHLLLEKKRSRKRKSLQEIMEFLKLLHVTLTHLIIRHLAQVTKWGARMRRRDRSPSK